MTPGGDVTAPPETFIHLANILVPFDFTEASFKALDYAVSFARQFNAKLTLLHVLPVPLCPTEFPFPGPMGQDAIEAVEGRLEQIRAVRIPAEVEVDTVVCQGYLFDGVPATAREMHADLIIIGTHGFTGLKHLIMGSTAEKIVRHAPCPVFVVREHECDFI